jgi:hypothetical protein
MTQDELSQLTGLSVRSIGKIESRRVGAPRPVTVRLLADAFRLVGAERDRFVALAGVEGSDGDHGGTQEQGRSAVPRQLPPAVTRLVGRDAEVAAVVDALTATSAAPTVVSVYGPGGVGKSALAVAAAHAAAPSFPDGQLYVDLQGATPAMAPLAVIDVVGRFLRALGVSPPSVPASEAEAVSLYRTVMADRRVLVVADNAGGADQVTALLPATPGSAVVATSRMVLAMLDGATRIGLEPLREEDARALLGSIAGAERAAREPDALATVARACGNLPLALRIAGARLVSRPDWTIADLARRLADERRTLHELNAVDETLRASLRVSWRELRADDRPVDALAARIFLALGAIRVPTVQPGLAAALCSTTVDVAELALDRLVDVRLADRHHDRYRIHDLLRLYAAELAVAESGRHEQLRTALTWYTCGADQVGRTMRGRIRASHRPQVDVLTTVTDAPSAGTWLDAERANMVALVRQALVETADTSRLAGDLVLAVYPAILMRGHAYEFEVLCRLVLDAADRVQDPHILGYIWNRLAMMYAIQARADQAFECAEQAVALHRLVGDMSGEASALEAAGMSYMRLDRIDEGTARYEAALRLRVAQADRYAEAITRCNLAEGYHRSGRSDEALGCLRRSLEIRREFGDLAGESITLLNLGEVYSDLGRDGEALDMAEAAIETSRRAGERDNERRSVELRARLRLRAGDIAAALGDCEYVLELTGTPDSGAVDMPLLIAALESAGQHEFAARMRRRTVPEIVPAKF